MSGWQVFVEVAGKPPFEVRPGESIVGRSRTAQVHIPESTVSRQHARLLASPLGEVTIEDLGSSNGTYVNNEKVEGRRRLADGDRIHVGDAELRVRIVAPVAPSEATVRMSLPPMSGPPAVPPAPPVAATPPQPAAPPPVPPLPRAAAPPPRHEPPKPVPPPAPMPRPLASPPPPSVSSTPPPPAVPPRPSPPPPAAPVPPPAPSAPPPALPAAPARRPAAARPASELPSVTAIDRIPIPEPTPEVIRASRLARATPAGFGVRFAATLIDAALVTFVAIPLWMMASLAVRQSPLMASVLVPAVFALLSLVYPVVFWATRGATPGKLFLRLRILGPKTKTEDGLGWSTAIVRYLGYVVGGALLGVGFLLILFTAQKQGLHDLIAGTRVVRLR